MTTAVDPSPSGERRTEPEWLIISPSSRSERRRWMGAGVVALAVIMIITARVVGFRHEADAPHLVEPLFGIFPCDHR